VPELKKGSSVKKEKILFPSEKLSWHQLIMDDLTGVETIHFAWNSLRNCSSLENEDRKLD
jgi:hypothetical protein